MRALVESSPTTRGRILAALYVTVIAGGIIGQAVIADSLVITTDAATTAANIVANKTLYRLAFTIFMVEMAAQAVTSMMFYDLLKPVNRSAARASLILGLVGCTIKTGARGLFLTPLMLLGGAAWLSAIPQAQLETLSLAFVRMNGQIAGIGLVFFGLEGFIRGWLIYRSGFLPRFLGVLSMLAGAGWATWAYPPLGSKTLMFVALLAIVGTVLMAGWLLVRGVDDEKWKARAALAQTSIWR